MVIVGTASQSITASAPEMRTRILAAALELIAKQGFAATSTREISEHLGITKAALYYHFRTKDDLLAALLAPAVEGLARLAEQHAQSVVAHRYALLAGYVELVVQHENLIRVLMQDPSTHANSAVLAAKSLCDTLIGDLSGPVPSDLALRTRARAALGCIHSAILLAAPNEDRDVICQAALEAACGALGIPDRCLS